MIPDAGSSATVFIDTPAMKARTRRFQSPVRDSGDPRSQFLARIANSPIETASSVATRM